MPSLEVTLNQSLRLELQYLVYLCTLLKISIFNLIIIEILQVDYKSLFIDDVILHIYN